MTNPTALHRGSRPPLSYLCLGLFWLWLWVVLRKPSAFPVQLSLGDAHFSPVVFSLVGSLAIFLSVVLLGGKRDGVRKLLLGRQVGYVLASAYVVIALWQQFSPSYRSIHEIVTQVATGLLISWLYLRIAAMIVRMGPKQFLSYSSIGLLVAFLVALLLYQLPEQVRSVCILLLPVSCIILADRVSQTRNHTNAGMPEYNRTAIPVGYLAAFFIQGMALGLLQSIFSTVTLERCTASFCILRSLYSIYQIGLINFFGFLSVFGLVLAIITMLLSMRLLKMNFRTLICAVGFPLMALGFLVIASDRTLVLGALPHAAGTVFAVGETLFIAGYYYVDVVILALGSYLATTHRSEPIETFAWLGVAIFLGHFCGLILCSFLVMYQITIIRLCVYAIFVMLTVGIVITAGDFLRGDLATASLNHLDMENPLIRACDTVAARYLLSPRERQVLWLLAHGRTSTSIAEQLYISKDTSRTHIKNIYQKAVVHSRQELTDMLETEVNLIGDQERRPDE